MTMFKKHQCPSCGGDLTVDNDKQMYCCTSCGSSYDYDYFREEKLNEMGETHLSRKEFGAAVDAYRLLLKKKPHDFSALRGLMLAAAYLKDIDGLVSIGEAKHFAYDSKIVREVIGSASEEDKEYFNEFAKIYSDKKLLIDCNREIISLRQERDRIEAAIRLTDDTRYDYYIHAKGGDYPPKVMSIMDWCFTAFFFMLSLGIGAAVDSSGSGGMVLAVVIFGGLAIVIGCATNFGYVYPRIKAIKKIDSYINEFNVELGITIQKIKKYEDAAKRLSGEIKENIRAFIEKDSLMMADSVKEQVPVVSTIKKHQCPSCGGSLRIDSDKQMYHCTFCGSTYDYEYFREDSIHEAGETYLSRGEFMATADAYDFMLKKDPHDFLALRGSMLAAAHMTSMSELDQEMEKEDFSYDPEMVRQAIENAAEEDKDYFKDLAKVYSEKKKQVDCIAEIKALWEEKRKINDLIAQNNLSRNKYYIAKASPKIQFIILLFVNAFWFLWLFILTTLFAAAVAAASDSVGALLGMVIFDSVICLGFAGYNFLFVLPKIIKLKKLDKENAKLFVEAGKMDEKIQDLENESAKLLSGLKRSIHDFVKKDRMMIGL